LSNIFARAVTKLIIEKTNKATTTTTKLVIGIIIQNNSLRMAATVLSCQLPTLPATQ